MDELRFTFIIERGDDGGWGATCPDLPGLLLSGDTREAMLNEATEIVSDYLLEIERRGLPAPTPGEHLATITVSV